jgi:hypothetical protein
MVYAATEGATEVPAQSFAHESETVIDTAMAGEALISTSTSGPAMVTYLNASGCAGEPLRREARIGGDATGRASTEHVRRAGS